MAISDIFELYSRRGASLIGNGLSEAVLPLDDVDSALKLFQKERWRVLGGDVYTRSPGGQFESTYENWHYEGRDVGESIAVARSFVGRLSGRPVYISFVVIDS
jgi:hypothetical protein